MCTHIFSTYVILRVASRPIRRMNKRFLRCSCRVSCTVQSGPTSSHWKSISWKRQSVLRNVNISAWNKLTRIWFSIVPRGDRRMEAQNLWTSVKLRMKALALPITRNWRDTVDVKRQGIMHTNAAPRTRYHVPQETLTVQRPRKVQGVGLNAVWRCCENATP